MPLSSIKGTGADGLIVKADIEDYLGNYTILHVMDVEFLFLLHFRKMFDRNNCIEFQSDLQFFFL